MIDAIKTILSVFGAYFLVCVVMSALQLFIGDRSGNSGRFGHWLHGKEDEDDGPA